MNDDVGGLDRVAANERLFVAASKSGQADSMLELRCECASGGCLERVFLASADYEPVRESASRYVIAGDDLHVDPEQERIVERHAGFWVVEREPSLEVVEFYSTAPQSIFSTLSDLAREARTLTDVSAGQTDDPAN